MATNSKKSQEGIAMITSVLFTGVLLSMVIALSAIFIPKLKVVAQIKSSIVAAYAAESYLEWCLYNRRILKELPPAPSPEPSVELPWTGTVTDCATSPVTATGTYRGVTRAFELSF